MSTVKVVIIGGGPAGLSLAAGLAKKKNTSVTVIEKTDYSGITAGEHLQSEALSLVEKLDIPLSILFENSIKCNSIIGYWGNREIESHGLFKINGYDLILNRPSFERALVKYLTGAGVEFRTGMSVSKITSKQVITTDQASIAYDHLFDCSGRQSRFTTSSRLIFDNSIGISFYLPNNDLSATDIVIESAEIGWWYSVSNAMHTIITLFTDADIYKQISNDVQNCLRQTKLISKKVVGKLSGAVVKPSFTSILKRSPDKILQVGDSFYSLDPLSSQGIFKALKQAVEISELFDPNSGTGAEDFYDTLQRRFLHELRTRRNVYLEAYSFHRSLFYSRRIRDYFSKDVLAM